MRIPLIKYGNIDQTITTILLVLSPLCPVFLVRLGGYTVNLSDFYSYTLIGKLAVFFSDSGVQLCNLPVDSSTSSARRSPSSLRQKLATPSPRLKLYVLILTLTVYLSSINLVFIFRCSSSPSNPVYGRCVDSSTLVFSLSSHRHSYIGLIFRSRFIDS